MTSAAVCSYNVTCDSFNKTNLKKHDELTCNSGDDVRITIVPVSDSKMERKIDIRRNNVDLVGNDLLLRNDSNFFYFNRTLVIRDTTHEAAVAGVYEINMTCNFGKVKLTLTLMLTLKILDGKIIINK